MNPLGNRALIVPKDTAVRYFRSRAIPNTDHLTISKPSSARDHVHQYLYDFLRDKQLLPSVVPERRAVEFDEEKREVVSEESHENQLKREWHPPEDIENRGSLTPCRFTLSPNFEEEGAKRWQKWGDVLAFLEEPPNRDRVFLLPSNRAGIRFRDPFRLKNPQLLAQKKAVTREFVQRNVNRELTGFWFYKNMSADGSLRAHLYCADYDQFLNTAQKRAPARNAAVILHNVESKFKGKRIKEVVANLEAEQRGDDPTHSLSGQRMRDLPALIEEDLASYWESKVVSIADLTPYVLHVIELCDESRVLWADEERPRSDRYWRVFNRFAAAIREYEPKNRNGSTATNETHHSDPRV